jgi:hypothetical protein
LHTFSLTQGAEPFQALDAGSDAHGVQLPTCLLQSPAQTGGLTGIQDYLEGSLRRYPAYQKKDGVGTHIYCGIMLQGDLLLKGGISLYLINIFIT